MNFIMHPSMSYYALDTLILDQGLFNKCKNEKLAFDDVVSMKIEIIWQFMNCSTLSLSLFCPCSYVCSFLEISILSKNQRNKKW